MSQPPSGSATFPFSPVPSLRSRFAWWRGDVVLYVGLCVIWFCLHARVLTGQRVLPWDAIDAFYPAVWFNAHSLRAGLAPWWNPFVYSGFPQIADPQGMLFSPTVMAWMIIPRELGPTWFAWGVLLHLLAGGMAMMAWLKRWGANRMGMLVGAMVFMAGGVAAARVQHVPIVVAYGLAPIVLLALHGLIRQPSLSRGLWVGLLAGAMLTQLVQVTYLLTLLIAAFALCASVVKWPQYSPADRVRWLMGVLVAIVIAGAMAAPQVVFTFAFSAVSNRSTLALDAAADASVPWHSFQSFLAPNALHALVGSYTGKASRVEEFFYIGALPTLLLIGLNGVAKNPRQRKLLLFFSVVLVLAVLYTVGLNTPFYGWLFSALPGMNHFRRPSDAAYLLNLALAVIVGLAASHVDLRSRRQVILLLLAASCWLLASSLGMRAAGEHWQAASLIAGLVGVGLLVWLSRGQRSHRQVMAGLILLMVVDYRSFNLDGALNESRDTTIAFMRDPLLKALTDDAKGQALPFRMNAEGLTPMWDNGPMLVGVRSDQGYDPLRYGLYDALYGARDNGSVPRVSTPFNPAPGSALSKLLGVRYYARATSMPFAGVAMTEMVSSGKTTLWRDDHTFPAVLSPTHAILLGVNELPPVDSFEQTDFRQTVWISPRDEADRSSVATQMAQCTGQASVEPGPMSYVRQSFRAIVPGGHAWLVFNELDFPGWQASVDGVAVPIYRANTLFRAVCIPAGDHRISFVFSPWGMVTSSLASSKRK